MAHVMQTFFVREAPMSHIDTRQVGHILEIKVNRPEKHNAVFMGR
jgi:hypothetical protein